MDSSFLFHIMNLGWSIVYNSSALEGVIGCTFQKNTYYSVYRFCPGKHSRPGECLVLWSFSWVFTVCQIIRLRESSMHKVNGTYANILQPIS